MSFIETIWRNIKHWWHGTESKYGVSIDQYPKEKVVIGIGGSTKLSAHVTASSSELYIKWQKVESNGTRNIQIDSIKYSGSSCSLPTPELIINDVDNTDAGVYQLSVTTIAGTILGQKVLLSVFGDPVDSLSKEKGNFLRYYLLCQTIATESVRLYFTRKIPEPTLASHLNSNKTNIKFSHWKCTSDQITVLFPAAPGHAKSSNFDFSLLYKLIRNTITPVSTPTRGWGQTPLPSDIREEDDIERIRHKRNLLAHNTDFQLNDSDFNNLWTDLSQAIKRLSLGSLLVDVIKLSKQKLDQQLKNEIFESMKVEINIIHQDMEECREKIQTIVDTHIPTNIRQTQIKLIKVWKQEDELYYDSTNVYQAIKDFIVSCTTVALVGGPGCGKTATARHIALHYEQNGWEIVPVFRPEEIVLYGDLKLKQIFVLDDMLGVFDVDLSLYNNINNHKEGILNAISNESKLVFTCRKSVYNEAIKLKSFVIKNIIDLQSEENMLNESEKENILAKHCRYRGVPENIYCNLRISSSSFIMFPLLCKIFSASHTNHVSVDSFFAHPFDCVMNELNELEYRTPQHYAALVLCVLSNNVLSTENLTVDKQELKLDAYNTCGITLGTSDKEIKNALSNLVGTYLSESENTFTFIHDAIYEITAYHYGKTNPHIILKYMKSNFISTKVTVIKNQGNDHNADLSILVDEKYYEQLAKRLYTDLQSFEVFDVFTNKSLKYLPFLKIFIKTLRKTPYYKMKHLICNMQDMSKLNHIRSYNDRQNDTKIDQYEEKMRQELLRNEYDFAREPHYPRIISWIIYYGHTNLLTSIVNLVNENKDSIDIVFGSDITEQTRSLTLGCYSGDPDMVNLILKFVKIGCINKTSFNNTHPSNDWRIQFNQHRTYTPLTSACVSGNLSVVQTLLKNNANMDQCDDSERFPLLCASEQGHYNVVEYLLEKGGNVNQCNIYKDTSLHRAACEGHYTVVKYLVQKGADVNQCNTDNMSPLYNACEKGNIPIVQFLVEKGADVHQFDTDCKSPLYKACEEGHKAVVEFLIEKGANINKCDIGNMSPLYIACDRGHTAIAEFLVEKEANFNQCDIDDQSPLYKASEKGLTAVIELLVEKGVDINQCDEDDKSPLYVACEGGHEAIVEFLVEKGANVNQCDIDDKSPLYKACGRGHKAVVEFLVEKGADVNQCSTDDMSPLYKACQGGHKAVVKYVVENGADVNHCDKDNNSPLYKATRFYKFPDNRRHDDMLYIVQYLIQKGADVNKCTKSNESSLFGASISGYVDVAELLVQRGAVVNQCNTIDKSPLYLASKQGYVNVVEYLVQQGANVNQCDIEKRSPLYKASKGGHKDVVEFLVDNGAVIHKCSTKNQSPLYKACQSGHTAVVEFLVEKGADVHQCDTDNISPLYKASEGGYKAIVEFLVDNGAVVDICDKNNQSPLYKACEGGHKAVVEFLVDKGADVNQCSKDDISPLYKACEGRHTAVVEFLVKQGADVHQCDIYNRSPLYRAFEGGCKSAVDFPVERVADIS